MSLSLASMDPVNATFILAILVLIAAVILTIVGVRSASDNSKQLFGIVGVLLGLFGAGGLGSLFVNQAADESASSAANKAAPKAANAAANQISEEVTQQVKKLKSPSGGSTGSSEGGGAGNTP
jgi:hypothetical protein